MKLEYKGKEYQVKTKTKVTPKLKVEFFKTMNEFKTDPTLEALSKLDKLDSLEILPLQRQAPPIDVIENNDKVYIKLFKLIVENPPEVFNDDEFWDEQDIRAITAEVNGFLWSLKI